VSLQVLVLALGLFYSEVSFGDVAVALCLGSSDDTIGALLILDVSFESRYL
jgi:hypothetical protein